MKFENVIKIDDYRNLLSPSMEEKKESNFFFYLFFYVKIKNKYLDISSRFPLSNSLVWC